MTPGGRLAALVAALLVSGCAGHVTRVEGPRIDPATVTRINQGSTTRQWVLDNFGEPTEAASGEDGERFIYIFREKTVPLYLGFIEREKGAEVATSILEITIQNDKVVSYIFKSEK